jgi:hypothetical protein
MPYTLKLSNRDILIEIPDGAIDRGTTSLGFVGKNVSGYGTVQNENFLYLLENFANSVPPDSPITGQLWFDSTQKQLRVYTADNNWQGIGNTIVGPTKPLVSTAVKGDLWYDSIANQLNAFNGSDFEIVGTSVPGFGKSRLEGGAIAGIKDGESVATQNPVLTLFLDDAVIAIISKYEFAPTSAIPNLHPHSVSPGRVFPGINLVGPTLINGRVDEAHKFIDPVDGSLATESFVRSDSTTTQPVAGSIKVQGTVEIGEKTVGSATPLVTVGKYTGSNGSGTDVQISYAGNSLVFKNKKTSDTDVMILDSTTTNHVLYPATNSTILDIGTTTKSIRNIYATTVTANLVGNVAGDLTGNTNGVNARVDYVKTRDGLTTVINTTTTTPTLTGNLVGNVTGNTAGIHTGNVTGNVTSTGVSAFSNISVTGGTITNTTLDTVNIVDSTLDTPSIADATLTGSSIYTGTLTFQTNNNTIATTAFVHNILPQGAIIMWSGPLGTIPTGWALCDGQNAGGVTTPDLRNKFILPAGDRISDKLPGTTGGATTFNGMTSSAGEHTHTATGGATTLTSAQIPSHGHLFDDIRWSEVSGTSTYNDPQLGTISVGPGAGSNRGTDYDNGAHFIQHGTYNTGGGQSHNHSVTVDTASDHNHLVTVSNVIPPYYALCYIIKIY